MKGGERIFRAKEDSRKSAEAHIIRQEGGLSFMELADKSEPQAEQALQNAELVTMIRPHVPEIFDAESDEQKESLCTTIAKSNVQLIPDHIEDQKEQAAYIMAIARKIANRQSKAH